MVAHGAGALGGKMKAIKMTIIVMIFGQTISWADHAIHYERNKIGYNLLFRSISFEQLFNGKYEKSDDDPGPTAEHSRQIMIGYAAYVGYDFKPMKSFHFRPHAGYELNLDGMTSCSDQQPEMAFPALKARQWLVFKTEVFYSFSNLYIGIVDRPLVLDFFNPEATVIGFELLPSFLIGYKF